MSRSAPNIPARPLAGLVLGAACATALAAARAPAWAAGAASLSTDRGCYVVGQAVMLRGSGFAPDRTYVVAIDGVYLGRRTTNAQGGFTIPVHPGGLPRGVVQHVDRLEVSDGTSSAATTFTLTRAAGAEVLATGGTPQSLRGRFVVWGFSLSGVPRRVYLHYIDPAGHPRATYRLGRTRGQCGFLRTGIRQLFPFTVSAGHWTLQLDTRRAYRRRPRGPLARIGVSISG